MFDGLVPTRHAGEGIEPSFEEVLQGAPAPLPTLARASSAAWFEAGMRVRSHQFLAEPDHRLELIAPLPPPSAMPAAAPGGRFLRLPLQPDCAICRSAVAAGPTTQRYQQREPETRFRSHRLCAQTARRGASRVPTPRGSCGSGRPGPVPYTQKSSRLQPLDFDQGLQEQRITPAATLDYWKRHFGLHSLGNDELAPYFEQAERRLSIGPWLSPPNENNDLLRRGAARLGIAAGFDPAKRQGVLESGLLRHGLPDQRQTVDAGHHRPMGAGSRGRIVGGDARREVRTGQRPHHGTRVHPRVERGRREVDASHCATLRARRRRH